MPDLKISAAPPNPAPAGTDSLATNKAGVDFQTTLAQVLSLIAFPPPPPEINDLSAAVTWANIPDANVPASAVTQHQLALSILESQIPDGAILARLASPEIIVAQWTHNARLIVAGGNELRIQDPTNLDRGTFAHDGVNFTLTCVNTADFIILGVAEFKIANYRFNVDQVLGAGQDGWVLTFDNATGQITAKAPAAAVAFPEFQFFADQLNNPITADWAINALAPASADSNNSGLTVRRFDDTVEEGIGFELQLPTGASNIIFDVVSRAETAPGVVNTVGIKFYTRAIPDNAVVTPWDAGIQLADISIPTNEFFQHDTFLLNFTPLGRSAGDLVQFEMTRPAPQAGIDLTGDWDLFSIKVSFT